MANIFIPLLAALITGAMTGAVVLAWAWALKFESPLQAAAIVGALAMVITWLAGYDRARRVSELERGVNVVDPPPPPPDKREASTVIRVTSLDLAAGDVLRFGLTPDKLQALAVGLCEGKPLTQVQWQGLLTRPQLAAVQAEFLRFGYCRWRSPGTPARGVEVTNKGFAVFRALASTPPPRAGKGKSYQF